MVKSKVAYTSDIPKGAKKVNLDSPFIDFKNIGDSFHGYFLGSEKRVSKKFGQEQNIWRVKDMVGTNFSISEKAAMVSIRMELSEGIEFAIQYVEDVPSDKGNPYKKFDLYLF